MTNISHEPKLDERLQREILEKLAEFGSEGCLSLMDRIFPSYSEDNIYFFMDNFYDLQSRGLLKSGYQRSMSEAGTWRFQDVSPSKITESGLAFLENQA